MKISKEIEKYKKIVEKYPDVEKVKLRWETVLISPSVIPDKFTIVASCGCCSDAALYLMPYTEIEDKKIFSSPCQICIGEKCDEGRRLYADWKIQVPKNLINEVEEYTKHWIKDET